MNPEPRSDEGGNGAGGGFNGHREGAMMEGLVCWMGRIMANRSGC